MNSIEHSGLVCACVCVCLEDTATDMAANLAQVQEATSKHSQLLRPSSVTILTHFPTEIHTQQLIQISLWANYISCCLYGRRAGNAEH